MSNASYAPKPVMRIVTTSCELTHPHANRTAPSGRGGGHGGWHGCCLVFLPVRGQKWPLQSSVLPPVPEQADAVFWWECWHVHTNKRNVSRVVSLDQDSTVRQLATAVLWLLSRPMRRRPVRDWLQQKRGRWFRWPWAFTPYFQVTSGGHHWFFSDRAKCQRSGCLCKGSGSRQHSC